MNNANPNAMAHLTQAALTALNRTLEERTPQELLQWARQLFGGRVAALTAMQRSGSVLCHMLSTLRIAIPVVFVDTGVLFAETLRTRDRIRDDYGLNVITLEPRQSMAEQTREFGALYLTPEGQRRCCHRRKREPLLAIAHEYDAFIGGLRRADGGKRSACPIVSVDPDTGSLRINPLANVGDAQLEAYIKRHDVIVNPLHAQGYRTIGCNRCTTPVLSDESRRAGRWRHLGQQPVYCGINPTDNDTAVSAAIELPQALIDRLLEGPPERSPRAA